MKIALFAVIGFALGVLVARMQSGSFPIPLRQIQALMQQAQSIVKAAQPDAPPEPSIAPAAQAPGTGAKVLRPAIEPIYRALFGSLDDAKAIAMAVEETAELERLLSIGQWAYRLR